MMSGTLRTPHNATWSTEDSLELYNVPAWGDGFFSASDSGHLLARPRRDSGGTIDLKSLVEDLRRRGYELPLLLRFTDILNERVEELTACMSRELLRVDIFLCLFVLIIRLLRRPHPFFQGHRT